MAFHIPPGAMRGLHSPGTRGLIFGLTKGWDWVKIVRAACVTASFKVQSPGAQNFKFTAEEFAARYEATYGEAL